MGARDHSLVSSVKERVSKRNLISSSVRPGVDILSHFLNVQHRTIAHATQPILSSDAQLRSCHKCFSHYRQPPSLHQPVLTFEWFAAANAKALILTPSRPSDVWSAPKLRSTVAIDMLQYSCIYSWADHTSYYQHTRGGSLIM